MLMNPEGTNVNLRKQEISFAYIKAIAATVGYAVDPKHYFMDHAGIDISIGVPGEVSNFLSPSIDAQVKCTSRQVLKNNNISYQLDGKTFNRLAHPRSKRPQILIIILVPEDTVSWIAHGRYPHRISTLIRASAYWLSLKGETQTEQRTKTVKIPVSQRFTSDVLRNLMSKAAEDIL